MQRTTITALALAGALCAAIANAAVDEAFVTLDATTHELPQSMVDRLLKDPPKHPRHPRGKIYCFAASTLPERVGFCMCYNDEACHTLAKTDYCLAKLGLIRPGLGVCKSDVETVIVPAHDGSAETDGGKPPPD